MTPQQYQRVTDLFDAALQRDAAARDSFVADTCADDAEVLRAVRNMLAQHDAPAFDLDSAALGNGLNLASLPVDHDAALPKSIGPFAILALLGTGGMSVVYRARQTFPDREVALKVLRHGVLSPAALRRFHAEVQTLAKLTHPNIAQVYQAGTYDDGQGAGGRPYFAMELVNGSPLTDFATEHRLSVAQKLRLMIDVCRAVQYAHLKGVIHRDLKPGNILVKAGIEASRHQGINGAASLVPRFVDALMPVPKVLDFGIARVTDADLTRATLTSDSGQIVGTLPYMSPEQLTGDAHALDLRSDVYSLGVVFFELLTGALPHPITDSAPLTEAVRRIGETEPRRLRAVDPSLSSELEIIVGAALERDRARRYQSADALADDVLAHLEHRPIRARPPGPALRARKWLRRHPTTAVAVGVVALALTAMAIVLAVQRERATRAAASVLAQTLDEARTGVQTYAADLDASRARERELADVRNQLLRFHPTDQAVALEQREQQLLKVQSDHDSSFHRIIESLSRAERLGAAEGEVRRLRARLYLARVREAEAAGDRFARSTYLDLVRRNDPAGELAGELVDRFPFSITSDPPGAQVHLFRMIEQSELSPTGEPRLSPVANGLAPAQFATSASAATDSAMPILPGSFALRVVDGRDVLALEDVIISIAGRPIRDSVFVVDGGSTDARPLDRLIKVDDVETRSMYDVLQIKARDSADMHPHRFVFEQAGGGEVSVTGASLDELNIHVAPPAEALERVGGAVDVWRGGRIECITLPPGLRVRVTSKPLLIGPQSLVGVTPLADKLIERGHYIAVLTMPGFEPLRIPVDIANEGARSGVRLNTWRLLPVGSTPDGFVRFDNWFSPRAKPMFIMEREVTCAEYFEFLNDPQTIARIDASPNTPMFYPRSAGIAEGGRDADGRFTYGPELTDNWPILCVSWDDAAAYAQWKTQKANGQRPATLGLSPEASAAQASGLKPQAITFSLPTHQEWLCAWGCDGANQYPWGMHYRPWWCSSNYAHAQPNPEPVMSFPIDESNLGVFDLAGSVCEWLDSWWIEERNQREFAGGSWGHAGFRSNDMFMLYGQNGMLPNATSGTLGFRLVLRVE